MNINSTISPNFEARLDVSKVKTNKARWENIAKVFREETKLIPDETIKVIENEFDTSIIGSPYKEMPYIGKIEAITYNKVIKELLEKYDDNAIAKKLIKLLGIALVADSRKEKAFEKYQILADRESWVPKDNFINKRDAEYEAIEKAAFNKVEKDGFLKHFEIII